MKKGTNSIYGVSMVVLYMVLRFGWNLYTKYWESFAELGDEYTKDYGTQQIALIEQVQAMPDVSQRRSNVSMQGTELDDTSAAGITYWQKLRRTIIKAVPGNKLEAAIGQAGGAHYEKARKGYRTEITELLTAGGSYLEANAQMLIDKGNMPATFVADYKGAKEAYDKEHLAYGSAKGDATDGTTDKVEANNGLYKNFVFMCGDAQIVLKKQKSIAKQFTFAAVKRLVTKDMGGIHFTIIDANKKPLTEAFVVTDESGEEYEVNARGVASILMKAGTHSITVEAPGYESYTGVVKVDAGVKHRVRIELKKQAIPEPATAHITDPAAEVAFTGETQLEQ